MTVTWALTAVVALLVPTTSPGEWRAPAVHLELRSSQPAQGDTLPRAPARLRLEFTETVDAATSEIALVVGGTTVTLRPVRDAVDHRVLTVEVADARSGWHRVTWRVLSVDGHAVSGSFAFYVTPAAGGDTLTVSEPPPEAEAARFPVLAAIVRGAASAGQLALAGVLVFLWRLGPSTRLSRLARLLAVLALAATGLNVLAWLGYTGFGNRPGSWVAVLVGAGRLEVLRFALMGLAFATVTVGGPVAGAFLAAAAAVLVGAGIGHAASFTPLASVPAKAVHLGAAAVWLGGLLTLVFGERDAETFARNARWVSGAALWAVIAVAISGVAQTVLIVSPRELIGSRYGFMIGAKVIGLAVLVAFGAFHRTKLLPRIEADGRARLRGSVAREVVVFLFVIVLAGVLGYVTPPSAVP